MTYSLKNVFYLGNTHEYDNAYAAGESGVDPIDVSAFVDPISKGRTRGQGLAVYRVHSQVSQSGGTPLLATETANMTYGLTVKPYTTTGDRTTGVVVFGDALSSSDLLIHGAQYQGGAAAAPGMSSGVSHTFLEPSDEVPYVVVRDTIFQIMTTSTVVNADFHISYRMECAMISLDTATLNQLLRTQTA